jgi:hypothetical protein
VIGLHQFGTLCGEGFVGEAGGLAGTALDQKAHPFSGESADCFRGGSHPAFAFIPLLGDQQSDHAQRAP